MTVREREILQYVTQFMQTNGYSPSIVEIMHGVCTGSKTHVIACLNSLEEQGYIERQHKKARTIIVKKFL